MLLCVRFPRKQSDLHVTLVMFFGLKHRTLVMSIHILSTKAEFQNAPLNSGGDVRSLLVVIVPVVRVTDVERQPTTGWQPVNQRVLGAHL